MTDIRDERIVKFTPNEVTELADFLRTFEANADAVRLLDKISMRSIDALSDAARVEQTPLFAPLPDEAFDLLSAIADKEKVTFDGWVKPGAGNEDLARELDTREFVTKHPMPMFNLYRTTETGRDVLAIISTEEPSA